MCALFLLAILAIVIVIVVQQNQQNTETSAQLDTLKAQFLQTFSSVKNNRDLEHKSPSLETRLNHLKTELVNIFEEKLQQEQLQTQIKELKLLALNQAFITTATSRRHIIEDYPEEIRITVLIPVYSGYEYLEECLQSVVNQTISPHQVVVSINGHPLDGDVVMQLQKLCETFMDKLPLEVTVYARGGKTRTLNRMVDESTTGNFVAILDVDDLWVPEKLELQTEILAKWKVAVVGSQCNYFGDKFGSPNIPEGHLQPHQFIGENPIINSSIVMLKHLALWSPDFDTGVEDYELWVRLTKEGHSMYNMPEPLVHHRIHQGSFFNTVTHDVNLKQLYTQHHITKFI